ncbi:MAG: hypothetical protein II319_07255 [Clostridia bacterium]|nr:hypothetical protein [Clostridia bacterium]
MSDIFIKIFNLSVMAGWLTLAVLICRPLMKKAPKWINCLLWGIVGLRLVFPFSLESIFSLIPSAEPLPPDIMMSPAPAINSGVGVVNSMINPIISTSLAPDPTASANPMQIVIAVASVVWIIGIALMLGYGIVSFITLRFKVRAAIRGEKNVYFCDEVDSPFILGVIRPRIYVPSGMSGEALEHVIAHEKAHLRRGDHLWKPVGFALLAFYWFNPLLWVAYALLCRDIESACDEKVIKTMDTAAKKSYSEALLSCSLHRKRIMACPLAFGEVGVKQRIKSVLNYKKPAFWIIIIALVATLVLSVCFLTNPKGKVLDELVPGSKWLSTTGPTISFGVYENGSVEGIINTADGNRHNIVIHYRKAGSGVVVDIVEAAINDVKYESENLTVTPEEHNEWYEQQVAEHSLISGMFRLRRGDLVLTVKKNSIGIESEEIVFKNVSSDDGELCYKIDLPGGTAKNYIYIHGAGFDNNRAEITFRLARCKDDDIYFVLGWKNKTLKPQMRGPDFEVYRYENGVPIALEHISYWKMYALSVDALSTTYPSYNLTEHYDISAPGKYRFECNGAWVEFEVINDTYLGLDASNGLDVFVWQPGQHSLSFALFPHSDRNHNEKYLPLGIHGVTASEMRAILSTYIISGLEIHIVPVSNMLTSYGYGDYLERWSALDDIKPYQNMYLAIVGNMLFGENASDYYPGIYEHCRFDIDGDGEDEYHKVCHGLENGEFMFSYVISKDGSTAAYFDNFYTEPMHLNFVNSADGKVRLHGRTEDGKDVLYDISVENGHVKLTVNNDAMQYEVNNATVVFDPSYSPYDSSRKYDVYVWQMAQNSFSFALLDSKPRDWLDYELFNIKGVPAASMRQILLDKNLGPDDVNIVRWQNPLSSYIGDFWIIWPYMNDNTPQENFYYAIVYDMLFGTSPQRYYPTATESEWFDIDGDGTKEENRIFFGLVDGKFMFRYIISEDNKTASYDDTFYTEPMSLKFFTSEEKLRLRGVDEKGGVHIYDIVLEGGHVKLAEINSAPIADALNKTLDLSKADLSLVNSIVVTNGKTGEVTYLNTGFNRTGFNSIMNVLKTVKASNPVSNKGHSGFNYHVELYYDFQTVFEFSLCNEPTDVPRIVCGYYETDGGFDYAARYQLTGEAYAKLEEVLKNYVK